MQYKDEGLPIVHLQSQLKWLGYPMDPDGYYGDHTKAIVCEFQHKNGLSVDGWAGKKTEAVIDKQAKDAWLYLFVHCTATKEGRHYDAAWIKKLHMEKKGWSRPGYSDCIHLDGTLEVVQKFDSDDMIGEWEKTFGVKGGTMMNRNSRHVTYVGGVSAHNHKIAKDTRTDKQKYTLEQYVRFMVLRNPRLIVVGHNQVQKKACPSFDVPQWLESIDIPDKHIARWSSKYSI
jgi:N-acetylmuramoyl-L-alanine amidase